MKKILLGLLLITTTGVLAKSYKGAEVYSNQSWKYGKIEMRMRMAKGSGILSTFFTYKNGSEGSGVFWEEIDIEVFGKNNATTFQSNIITNNPKKYSEQVHSPGYSMGDAYHTYTLEWTPDYVAWYIDGVQMRKTVGGQVSELTNPESFRFNLWAASIVEWVGSFDPNVLPVYQFVNWIKYSAYTPGAGDNGTDFTLNWTDEFDTFNTSRWSKANWTFNENLTDFDPNNVVVKDGFLVLVLSREGQTGFSGTVPPDQITNPTPTVSITSPVANATFCTGSAITINANASVSSGSISKVDFYDGNTLIGSDNTSPYSYSWTNATAGAKTIRAIATSNANVTSTAATVTITVSAPVTITPYIQTNGGSWLQQSTTQLCAGGSVGIGPQPNTQTGWTWTGPNGYSANTREITLNNIIVSASGKYTATYNDGTCTSTAEVNITVNAVPSAPVATANTPLCEGSTLDISTASVSGATYAWTGPGGFTATSNQISRPNATTSMSGTYSVVNTVNGCSSTAGSVVVAINTKPSAPIVTSPVVYTQNSTAVALTANGTALMWYSSATAPTGSTTAPVPSTATVGNTSYFVSQTINSCESPRAEIIVTVNPAEVKKISLHTGWNLVGCPLTGTTNIEDALSSIWQQVESVKDMQAYYVKTNPEFLNTLKTLSWGRGYYVKVTADCELIWND